MFKIGDRITIGNSYAGDYFYYEIIGKTATIMQLNGLNIVKVWVEGETRWWNIHKEDCILAPPRSNREALYLLQR
jgi:hypothetical protein